MGRVCEVCGNPLPDGSRPERKYCKTSCKNKAQYWRDPEKARTRNRALTKDQPVRRASYNRKSYQKHKKAQVKRARAWEARNPQKVSEYKSAYNKTYAEQHREARNARQRERRRKKRGLNA